jgi:hypothetical protein
MVLLVVKRDNAVDGLRMQQDSRTTLPLLLPFGGGMRSESFVRGWVRHWISSRKPVKTSPRVGAKLRATKTPSTMIFFAAAVWAPAARARVHAARRAGGRLGMMVSCVMVARGTELHGLVRRHLDGQSELMSN